VNLPERLDACRARVEARLAAWLPPADETPRRLHAAMRYATLSAGKRVRPMLVYLTGDALDVPIDRLDGPACAVELIHAYSLVHDDLPAMDDDDLRRGRPTCHREFDEATAILAGDALQVLAFRILSEDESMVPDPAKRLRIIHLLATGSGTDGMAGGQAIDLAVEGRAMDVAGLERMHLLKTGALIRSSVLMAAWSADRQSPAVLEALDDFGRHIGLAFQIRDDVLDVEGDTGTLGKTAGADSARDKPTYPSVAGIEEAKRRASELCHAALDALAPLGPGADPLRRLARYIVLRDY
jgi:geranylgeranyl diphosphate synthase type II